MRVPLDAMFFDQGCYYKLGRFGFVYRWNGEEWIRTLRTSFQKSKQAMLVK